VWVAIHDLEKRRTIVVAPRFTRSPQEGFMADLGDSEAKTEQLELSDELKERLRTAFITDEKSFSDGQHEVEEMIAAKAPLSNILTTLVRMIEAQAPGMVGSVLLLSPDGNHIEHGSAPSLPDFYVKAIDGEPIGPKCGSCGTAMYRGERVVVTDVLTDPLWEDYRTLAAAAGLRACWSTPIMSSRGKVLGSFAMYYRQPQTPTGEEARLTEVATRLAARAIENRSAASTGK
jgi:GAF domain-containing protein